MKKKEKILPRIRTTPKVSIIKRSKIEEPKKENDAPSPDIINLRELVRMRLG